MVGCSDAKEAEEQNIPATTPSLYLSINNERHIQALRMGGYWVIYDENGIGIDGSPLGDRFLTESDLDEATLYYTAGSIIELDFNNYPPDSIRGYRENTKYESRRSESIEVIENTIHVDNDGYDYIYRILAEWSNERVRGRVAYVFRTISGEEPLVY